MDENNNNMSWFGDTSTTSSIYSSTIDATDIEENIEEPNFALEFDKELFLEVVRKYRCLWDTHCEGYKNRPMKQTAWVKIGQVFNKDVEFLQKQMKNLKDSLKKCLDKRTKLTRSGAGASVLPKCKYFEQMRFLHDRTANKPTESNLQPEPGIIEDVASTSSDTSINNPIVCAKRKITETPAPPPKNRHGSKGRQSSDPLNTILLQNLETTNEAIMSLTTKPDNDNEVSLYCRSLIPIISSLPLRKRRLAMIKVSQLLFDLEFDFE
ncbi:uncharacterized protein [Antedon mediterranea]|uniref:uncharacterized protein n=1 Tax=Antedon mediterranea TaxID=105859 RepID=UPI003AF829BE